MQFANGDQTQSMEMVVVDGLRYLKSGGQVQTPDVIMRTEEMTLITLDDVAMIEAMTYVGVETVNGREADHYRGAQDIIPVFGTEGDTLDVSEVEFAQLDMWVDRSEQVVVKFLLEASDSAGETPVRMSVMTEYSDFNQDFVIEAA